MKLIIENFRKYIEEELEKTSQKNKSVFEEHRGKKCSEKTGEERKECEEKKEAALKRSRETQKKKRQYSANEEELEALSRGKVYGSRPGTKTRKDDIQPKIQEKQKKKKRKQCSSRADGRGHNRYHDSLGRLSTKANATSTSIRTSKKDGCVYAGQAQMPGEKIVRIPCGRLNPKNPNRKGTWRCKDKTKYWEKPLRELLTGEDDFIQTDDWVFIKKDALDDFIMDNVIDTLQKYEDWLSSEGTLMSERGNEDIQAKCNAYGYRNLEQWLRAVNAIRLAQDGKLLEPPKEKK